MQIARSKAHDTVKDMTHHNHTLIYAAVEKIPRGRVATYGQVAELADLPGNARQVGHALSCLPEDTNIPWHRVINAKGEISMRRYSLGCEDAQRTLLLEEGIQFNSNGRISLAKYQLILD